MSPLSPADAGHDDAPGLALRFRLQLSHAAIASLLEGAGVRALHVKGYAALPGVYRSGRRSTDVDLLFAPADALRGVAALEAAGWEMVTDFASGSIFQHAATLWHRHLGYVDVHRAFPGIGLPADEAFELLWEARAERVRAGHRVPVPCLEHQQLLVFVHASHDRARRDADVGHLREAMGEDQWGRLREQVLQFHAEAAWEAATGESLGASPADVALLRVLADGGSAWDLFRARWAAARGPVARARMVAQMLPANRDHLSMSLGRPATAWDALRWQGWRVRELARTATARVTGRKEEGQ